MEFDKEFDKLKKISQELESEDISLDDNTDATLNEFIDYINVDCSESDAELFNDEMAANKIADKIYIVLGVKCIVEKVGDKDE